MATADLLPRPVRRSERYSDFAHTGPGTLAGRLMRSFWQPVYVSDLLPPGRAVPVRVMGADFTLYRGEGGAAHVIDARCAHRGTQLSTGWVEEDCIRCFYHGWKYDGSGQCVEQPAEEGTFAAKVRIRSYPVMEQLGFVYAYLGEGDPPEPQHYPEFERDVVIDPQMRDLSFNFYQGLENSVDTVHVSFVHRSSNFYTDSGSEGYKGFAGLAVPSYYEETDYGLIFEDVLDDGTKRLAYFEMPNVIHIKVWPVDAESGWRDLVGWKVPIDDVNFRNFTLTIAHVGGEAAERYKAHPMSPRNLQRRGEVFELGEDILAGRKALRPEDVGEQARSVNLQDYVAQKGQGIIADREHERLGKSDGVVILLRQLWSREMQKVDEGQPIKRWRWPGNLETVSGA